MPIIGSYHNKVCSVVIIVWVTKEQCQLESKINMKVFLNLLYNMVSQVKIKDKQKNIKANKYTSKRIIKLAKKYTIKI